MHPNKVVKHRGRHNAETRLHIIFVRRAFIMTITNTYLTSDAQERLNRQAAIHRRCILLLKKSRDVR